MTGTLEIALHRKAHLFVSQPGLMERLESDRTSVLLQPDQLFHPDGPCEAVVRLGKLRLTQFLPDGREITRAVLHAGTAFTVRSAAGSGDNPREDVYCLAEIVLMSLGEADLWLFSPGSLKIEE